MNRNRYYAHWYDGWNAHWEFEDFDNERDVLAIVAKVNADSDRYSGLTVVYGEELTFETYETVLSWRVKEPE